MPKPTKDTHPPHAGPMYSDDDRTPADLQGKTLDPATFNDRYNHRDVTQMDLFHYTRGDRYSAIWGNRKHPQTYAGMNIAPALLNVLWFAYRKMYVQAIVILGLFVLTQVVMATYELEFNLQFVLMAVLFFYGNSLYYRHAYKKVKKIKAKYPDPDIRAEKLHKKGGTNWIAPIILATIILSYFFYVFVMTYY